MVRVRREKPGLVSILFAHLIFWGGVLLGVNFMIGQLSGEDDTAPAAPSQSVDWGELIGGLFPALTENELIPPSPPSTETAGAGVVSGSGSTSSEIPATPRPDSPVVIVTELSPVFTPEVQYWANDIVRWSAAHGITDPNLVAIVMQIESCGYQDAVSSAGATGLFQVMPFHFDEGEVMLDPETNAYRGMLYLSDLLQQTNDVGLAFAGYNGGPGVMVRSWDTWPNETQRYYRWTTGIHQDIQGGQTQSETLQRWLEAGGSSLCQKAAARQASSNPR